MLILTRRVGETLMIGDEVTVTVLGVKGNQVRIGVNAPKKIAVHREEIYRRIEEEKRANMDDSSEQIEEEKCGNTDDSSEQRIDASESTKAASTAFVN